MSDATEPKVPVLDNIASKPQLAFAELMPRVAKEYGKPLSAQLRDMLSCCMRGNKLTVDEYYQMMLFDDATYSADVKKTFVGLQKSRDIWVRLTEPNQHLGLLNDKLAYEKMMQGFGFATTETVGIVGGHYPEAPGLTQIDSAEKLTAFFANVTMPVFGKPVDSLQSLGSARFESFDRSSKKLNLANGETISVEDLFEEIVSEFGGSYIFQKCVQPHSALADICAGGLPTVRVVTLDSGNGPELYRAAIKLTSSGNVADNFWRAGNMLAPVDIENGIMDKALTQMGIDGEFLSHHPVTNAPIEGTTIPHWDKVTNAAIDAAKLIPGSILIGFDIAISQDGPVIIEANGDPHLIMLQVAHRKGVLDGPMLAALDHVKEAKKKKQAEISATLAAERAAQKKAMKQATSRKVA